MGCGDCVQGTEGECLGSPWAGSVELAYGEEAGRRAQVWTLFSVRRRSGICAGRCL